MDLGLVLVWGGMVWFVWCIGCNYVLDMIFRVKKILGLEVLCIGLVNEVWFFEELKDWVIVLVEELVV